MIWNPQFDSYEVKGSIPKEDRVNFIAWFEVLGWIPRGSCKNIHWCRFRDFDDNDDDDEYYSLAIPVAESEGHVLTDEASMEPSLPETPATPQPPSPPLPLSPPTLPLNNESSNRTGEMSFFTR